MLTEGPERAQHFADLSPRAPCRVGPVFFAALHDVRQD